jgi:LacI family sucrose operon transcriptional repressor
MCDRSEERIMATLKDVAKEAGLTVGTVSRVLNNRGYISDDAREKVNSAMKKLNYHPNEVARSLQGKSTNTIGLIVPHIRHPYFAEMISNIENQAYKKGYRILLCNAQSIEEKEREYIDICTGNRVAGIILCSGTVSVEVFDGIRVPVITMERFLENGTAAVECDNRQGGALAAERLISSAPCGKYQQYIHAGRPAHGGLPASL